MLAVLFSFATSCTALVFSPAASTTRSPAHTFARMLPPVLAATELPQALTDNLHKNGIASLNPLQEVAVDAAMRGLDVIVHAETGSGKTLCYAMPLLARTLRSAPKSTDSGLTPLRALVLVPTLELAAQVARVFNALEGDSASAVARDATELPRDAPIVVGPPAVLTRLLSGGSKSRKGVVPRLSRDLLSELSCVVVDEADALLMPLGRYATKKQVQMRADKPKAAATLLQLLSTVPQQGSRSSRGGGEGSSELQVIAASATVGRPLRRELQNVCGRKFEVVRWPEDGGGASLLHADADGAQREAGETGGGGGGAPKRAVGLASGLSVGVVTYEGNNVIAALHDLLDQEAPAGRVGSGQRGEDDAAVAPLLFLPAGRSLRAEMRLLEQCELRTEALDDVILAQAAIVPNRRLAPDAEPAAQQAASQADGQSAGLERQKKLLVATPSGARGLDLHGLRLVVIWGVPKTADAFVHLAGRTARQGSSGRVVVLAKRDEADARLPSLGSQLGVDFRADRRHVDDSSVGGGEYPVEKWAEMWEVHEKIVRAAEKGY